MTLKKLVPSLKDRLRSPETDHRVDPIVLHELLRDDRRLGVERDQPRLPNRQPLLLEVHLRLGELGVTYPTRSGQIPDVKSLSRLLQRHSTNNQLNKLLLCGAGSTLALRNRAGIIQNLRHFAPPAQSTP